MEDFDYRSILVNSGSIVHCCGNSCPHVQQYCQNASWVASWSSTLYVERLFYFSKVTMIFTIYFFSQRNQDFYIISGGDDTSGSITRDVIRPELIPNRSKKVDGRIREKNQESNISKTNDGQTTLSNEGNVVNNNNDKANVNTVNNMNTNIDTSNNNVNVLDVIMVGSLSPRLGHRPIG